MFFQSMAIAEYCWLCGSMEVVWHGQFDRLFNTFPHQWTLQPVTAAEPSNNGEYIVFQDSAKVRFLCKVTRPRCIIIAGVSVVE